MENDTGDLEERPYQGRHEVAIDTHVELRKHPPPGWVPGQAPWVVRMREANKSTGPVTISFEGRRFTWHPGTDGCMTVVTVMYEDSEDYYAERFALERFLSAVSYRYGSAITTIATLGTSFRNEFESPRLRVPVGGAMHHMAPETLELADASNDLSRCLALMREGLSSESRALAFLSYWKVIELIAGGQRHVQLFTGSRHRHLSETRIAAAHAIPRRLGRLRHHPDDPRLAARLAKDTEEIYKLARRAIDERWPDPVKKKGQQYTT